MHFGPWARHIYPSLVLVQPRKTRPCLTERLTRPYITERLLMGRKESNQTNKPATFWMSWGEGAGGVGLAGFLISVKHLCAAGQISKWSRLDFLKLIIFCDWIFRNHYYWKKSADNKSIQNFPAFQELNRQGPTYMYAKRHVPKTWHCKYRVFDYISWFWEEKNATNGINCVPWKLIIDLWNALTHFLPGALLF